MRSIPCAEFFEEGTCIFSFPFPATLYGLRVCVLVSAFHTTGCCSGEAFYLPERDSRGTSDWGGAKPPFRAPTLPGALQQVVRAEEGEEVAHRLVHQHEVLGQAGLPRVLQHVGDTRYCSARQWVKEETSRFPPEVQVMFGCLGRR